MIRHPAYALLLNAEIAANSWGFTCKIDSVNYTFCAFNIIGHVRGATVLPFPIRAQFATLLPTLSHVHSS
jgi:hypothetical protein